MLVPTIPDQTTLLDLIRPGHAFQRQQASTQRASEKREAGGEDTSKRARTESPKKARSSPLDPKEPHVRKVEVVQLGDEKFYHMDESDYFFNETYDFVEEESEKHGGEEEPQGDEALWFREQPDLNDEELKELDKIANTLEVERLIKMGVLKKVEEEEGQAHVPKFSTKFVRTWRDKKKGDEMWKYRRTRLVTRKYRWLDGSRDDSFSPTTSAFMLKMLPHLFLSRHKAKDAQSQMALCVADVKDAFLTVPQPTEVLVQFPHDSEVDG